MSQDINKKLPLSTLAFAAVIIVVAWFLLFFTIPFFIVPAAQSNNTVLSSIGLRLNITAMGFFILLVILARNRVSNAQFWEVVCFYGSSWIAISILGEGFAEYVYAQHDSETIDTGNALIVTLINSATFAGPAIFTLIISRHIIFRQSSKKTKESQGHQKTSLVENFLKPLEENVRPRDPTSSKGAKTVSPAKELKKLDKPGEKMEEVPVDVGAKKGSSLEASDAIESDDGWSEKFKILYEYDPLVKACHDELEALDPQVSSQFREEVISDRKKAIDILDRLKTGHEDRLKAEHEKKMRPYTSEELNNALSEARLLGPAAEKEFTRVVDVMDEDIDVEIVSQRLKEKFGVLTSPEDMDAKLKFWGIGRTGINFTLGEFIYGNIDEAIAYAERRLVAFLSKEPLSKLQSILKSCGYTVETGDDDLFSVTSKYGVSVTLMADEFPRFIKGKISPNEIRQHVDYLT